mgnify:CR=1 FL=1
MSVSQTILISEHVHLLLTMLSFLTNSIHVSQCLLLNWWQFGRPFDTLRTIALRNLWSVPTLNLPSVPWQHTIETIAFSLRFMSFCLRFLVTMANVSSSGSRDTEALQAMFARTTGPGWHTKNQMLHEYMLAIESSSLWSARVARGYLRNYGKIFVQHI